MSRDVIFYEDQFPLSQTNIAPIACLTNPLPFDSTIDLDMDDESHHLPLILPVDRGHSSGIGAPDTSITISDAQFNDPTFDTSITVPSSMDATTPNDSEPSPTTVSCSFLLAQRQFTNLNGQVVVLPDKRPTKRSLAMNDYFCSFATSTGKSKGTFSPMQDYITYKTLYFSHRLP